jgi:hypothetical protein
MTAKDLIKPGIVLFTVSLIIIITCYFLPLTTSCEFTDGPEEFISTNEIGALQSTYYLAIIFLAFIFMLSLIKSKAGFISVILVSVIGGMIILFFNWIGQAGWGKPCGHQPTIYQNLLYLGHILFVLACCIKSYKNKNWGSEKRKFEDSRDLLDRI